MLRPTSARRVHTDLSAKHIVYARARSRFEYNILSLPFRIDNGLNVGHASRPAADGSVVQQHGGVNRCAATESRITHERAVRASSAAGEQ